MKIDELAGSAAKNHPVGTAMLSNGRAFMVRRSGACSHERPPGAGTAGCRGGIPCRVRFLWQVVIWLAGVQCAGLLGDTIASRPPWFAVGQVHEIRMDLTGDCMDRLRSNPRGFVEGKVRIFGGGERAARMRLKGGKGSYRNLDEGPSWTVEFLDGAPDASGTRLHRIHLNNSAEDPSFLCEQLGSQVFQAVGIAAPRISHARLRLNGREAGLFVMKESFEGDFLRRVQPVIVEKKHPAAEWGGNVTEDELVLDPNVVESMDVESFATFLAVEVLVAHRDGLGLARNNFRVYRDLARQSRPLLMTPWGLDQLFLPAEMPIDPVFASQLARRVFQSGDRKTFLAERTRKTWADLGGKQGILDKVHQLWTALSSQLHPGERRSLHPAFETLCARIEARSNFVEKEFLRLPGREALDGPGVVGGWNVIGLQDATALLRTNSRAGRRVMEVRVLGNSLISWRAEMRLAPGRYAFGGMVACEGIAGASGKQIPGVGFRILGSSDCSPVLGGTRQWQKSEVEFTVKEQTHLIELAMELRAGVGTAFVDLESLGVRPIACDQNPFSTVLNRH